MFSKVKNGSDSLTLLEVYKTDEENFEPYTPNMGESETTSGEVTNDEGTDSDSDGFTLHQGEVIETYYFGDLKELSFESDYADISNNGSLKFAEIKDLVRFYKGVRLLLRKKWREPNETVTAEDLVDVLLGFITEQSFNESGMDLTISGFTKLLDANYEFDFTQMKRSEILEEMIKTAGLKAEIDVTNLQDDIIDYQSSSGGDGGDEGTGSGGSDSKDINTFVKKAIKGKKGSKAKAEAVHNALKQIIRYAYYACSRHSTAEDCMNHAGELNCADTSRLTCACFKAAKLNARVVHGPNHFWTEVQINGQWVASDLTGCTGCTSRRSLGEVWNGLTKDSVCGDEPSC